VGVGVVVDDGEAGETVDDKRLLLMISIDVDVIDAIESSLLVEIVKNVDAELDELLKISLEVVTLLEGLSEIPSDVVAMLVGLLEISLEEVAMLDRLVKMSLEVETVEDIAETGMELDGGRLLDASLDVDDVSEDVDDSMEELGTTSVDAAALDELSIMSLEVAMFDDVGENTRDVDDMRSLLEIPLEADGVSEDVANAGVNIVVVERVVAGLDKPLERSLGVATVEDVGVGATRLLLETSLEVANAS
jgi:hypothetical protein